MALMPIPGGGDEIPAVPDEPGSELKLAWLNCRCTDIIIRLFGPNPPNGGATLKNRMDGSVFRASSQHSFGLAGV